MAVSPNRSLPDCLSVRRFLRSGVEDGEVPVAREQRKLAAILFADAVGSSRLMGRDESGTVARLLEHLNQRLAPAATHRGGRVVRLKGDGSLVEFASAVDAFAAAITFQQTMIEANRGQPDDQAIVFRVGLHLGDVVVQGDDIYGDAVNVAARLEAEAPAGGIVVSRAVREAVTGRLKVSLHPLGELALKNIERPIRAFRAEWNAEDWPAHSVASEAAASPKERTPALALPDKPSIAVLPFENMSGDPEQEYFADGMVEEIITALSRIRWLFVIARNSSFTYRGQAVDIKQVGRDLGVRYVLEGSVRKDSSRVRINAQLIDASNGAHLWADRFDGSFEDVFELQDRVAISVAGVIEPTLQAAEIRRSTARPINDLTAYDLYLRTLPLLAHGEGETAFQLLNQALKRDPHCGPALSLASFCHYLAHLHHWTTDRQSASVQGLALARKALRHAPDDPEVLARTAFVLGYFGENTDSILALVDQSLELNPSYAMGWYWSAILRNWAGEPEDALVRFGKYLRLSPRQWGPGLNGIGISLFLCRRFEEAAAKQRECLERNPHQTLASRFLAASYAHLGRFKEAREIGRRLGPALWDDGLRFRNLEQRELYLSGLRLASSQDGGKPRPYRRPFKVER